MPGAGVRDPERIDRDRRRARVVETWRPNGYDTRMPTYEKTYLKDIVSQELSRAQRSLGDVASTSAIEIRPSERPEFGDYSTNLAMIEAKASGRVPRTVAEALIAALAETLSAAGIVKAEVAGPGFVNLFLSPECIRSALRSVLADGDEYGSSPRGKGVRLQVEFVSSNPTGPLTVGHGRQAVLGDVLAALYERLGYDVQREYYFNDQGRQVDLLAESLWIRYRELFGESREIPEGGYQGEYLQDLAVEVRAVVGDAHVAFDETTKRVFRQEAVTRISDGIRKDLVALGIHFDCFFSEATLHDSGKVVDALAKLRTHDVVYDEDGAVWLRAEDFGGAKNSVLIRSDGRPTYMMVDIAYHMDKRDRGFERVIDVQGADHQVEQTCVKAALRALGIPETFLRYAVHQFVSLKQGGAVQRMSTRAGRFVTLRDLLDEVGADVVRYFMISRKPEAHLEFDLDLAKSQSLDNPATTIQYAHTRIASLFRKAGALTEGLETADLSPLVSADDLSLIKKLDLFPEIVKTAAESFAPHLLAEYALEVARAFHAYYDRFRILGEANDVARARLALLAAVHLVLAQSLRILGMTAPEEM
jgi:arginyl-tRNA synthetase